MKGYTICVIVGELICEVICKDYFTNRWMGLGMEVKDHSDKRIGIVSEINHEERKIYINSNPDYVFSSSDNKSSNINTLDYYKHAFQTAINYNQCVQILNNAHTHLSSEDFKVFSSWIA
jgi:hypothetical protein